MKTAMHLSHAPLFKVGSGAGLLVQLCLINQWLFVALADTDMEPGASFAELNRQKELDMHPSASSFNIAPSSLRGARSPMMTAERSRSIDDAAHLDFITTAPDIMPKDFIKLPELIPMENDIMKVVPGIAIPSHYNPGRRLRSPSSRRTTFSNILIKKMSQMTGTDNLSFLGAFILIKIFNYK